MASWRVLLVLLAAIVAALKDKGESYFSKSAREGVGIVSGWRLHRRNGIGLENLNYASRAIVIEVDLSEQ